MTIIYKLVDLWNKWQRNSNAELFSNDQWFSRVNKYNNDYKNHLSDTQELGSLS
jgi:hypothetical protein